MPMPRPPRLPAWSSQPGPARLITRGVWWHLVTSLRRRGRRSRTCAFAWRNAARVSATWSRPPSTASSKRDDLVLAWNEVARAFGAHDAPSTLIGVAVPVYAHQLVGIQALAALSARST